MGICCTGKLTKSDYKGEEIVKPNIMPKGLRSAQLPNAGINYEIQEDILNTNICQLISSSTAIMNPIYPGIEENGYSLRALPIHKTNLEYLWNVFVEYKEDFTACAMISLDLRKSKPENFLKKMKKINYSIDDMLQMSNEKVENFKRYLNSKTVIVILESEATEDLAKIIQFFIEKQFNIAAIKILNTNLNVASMGLTEKFFYNSLDKQGGEGYPSILLSFRYLSHFKSDNYIFFQKVNMNQVHNSAMCKFTPDHLSNSKVGKDDPYLSFWNYFRISMILRVSNSAFSEASSEFKRVKTEGEAKYTLASIAFTAIQERPKVFNGVFDRIKQEVNLNKSVIIQIDESFPEKAAFVFTLLLMSKVSSLPISLIIEYLSLNVPFIHNAQSLYTTHQKEINEVLTNYE